MKKDIVAARAVLDADHYGLEKMRTVLLNFWPFNNAQKAYAGPILCLVGPPGVGETSLEKSIARDNWTAICSHGTWRSP